MAENDPGNDPGNQGNQGGDPGSQGNQGGAPPAGGAPMTINAEILGEFKDDPAFKKLVDATLADMVKSGEFEAMYKKWFQSPIPPKGINLNAPMSKELKDNLTILSDKPAG